MKIRDLVEAIASRAPASERIDVAFEYRVVMLRDDGRQPERVVTGAIESQLNELGAAGWELAGVVGERAIFKRPTRTWTATRVQLTSGSDHRRERR